MIRYRSRRPPEAELRARLRTLANQRRRFGYRRLFILLRREGEPSGINRIYRLYREEGLTVRKRRARRRAVGTRTPILVEARVNARWSLDFVHDQFARGRRFRILNIADDVTRECLAAIPDTSISGKRVARELTNGQHRPNKRDRRNDSVYAGSIRQTGINIRAGLIDAAPQRSHNTINDSHHVIVVLKCDRDSVEFALALDIDILGAIHHDFCNCVIFQKRLERSKTQNFRCDLLE